MDVFIVRPFGPKPVKKKDKVTGKSEEISFDFDKVEELLILPALAKVNLEGGTTGKIFESGDIREDMFSLLLLADIVVADITIHNANVFYELGIRHALRDKKTILIRCPGFDETPFDIIGSRYISYDKDDPAKAIGDMVKALEETMLSNRSDSPVFKMLPKLEAQDTERLLALPPDFGEEVEIARSSRQIGKLALLSQEARGFGWTIPAMRVVGEAQFCLKDFEDAQLTWEKVRSRYPNDIEANDRLATIYQRLAETEMQQNPTTGWELLAQSDIAIKRLLDNIVKLPRDKQGEVYALIARNAKTKWLDSWKKVKEEGRKKEALKSPFLKESYENYQKGYDRDLNHYYSGINALGLLTTMISLAEDMPDTWELEFDAKEDADLALKRYKDQQQKLAITVEASLNGRKKQVQSEGKVDPWLNMTEADLCCLTSKRPQRVGSIYQKVIQEASDLNFESAKRQLVIYEQLGVYPDNIKAALEAFQNAQVFNEDTKRHYLLFTGHMIDQPGRTEPRFPAEKEEAAKNAIREVMLKELSKIDGPVKGIAGGACGGDILFHELCGELNIPSELYLALPREKFLVESVQFAGPDWVERFDKLYKKLPRKILAETKELPKWLQKKAGYSIWQRNNLWMLYNALVCGGIQMTLVALWDGKGGDAAGGTEHMVQQARERGSKIIVINTMLG